MQPEFRMVAVVLLAGRLVLRVCLVSYMSFSTCVQMRPGFQVVASVVHHPDEPPRPLPDVLLAYMVRHFDSITAAKKACRRKEVMVQGKVCTTAR